MERVSTAVSPFLEWAFGVNRPCKVVRQPPYLWQREDLIDPPLRPLPTSRPRRLTSQQPHPQLQSPLIARLPPEIRMLIWEHVLGRQHDRDVLHIELADGILRYNRCYEPSSSAPAFQHPCWTAAWRKSFRAKGKGKGEPSKHRYPILSLLFTCKLLYTETVSLLYTTNTFSFRRTDALLRLPHIVLPQRLQSLRRFHFSTAFACYHRPEFPPGLPADFWKLPDDRRQWPTACTVLASLHLLDLRVEIVHICHLERHRHPPDLGLWEELLVPLRDVKAAECVVEITEAVELVRERIGAMPFRLIEREKPKPFY